VLFVTLQEFRKLVRSEFGADLRHMTPANAREFLDRVQTRVDDDGRAAGRYHLNEPEHTYEGIVRDFLNTTLEMPPEQAVIRLWVYCLELATASLSDVEAERFRSLFVRAGLDGSE
jgi:hypothetical protein